MAGATKAARPARTKKARPHEPEDDADVNEGALKAEVAAFAAQLGFGTGGLPNSDAFSDFAPEQASKPISKTARAKTSTAEPPASKAAAAAKPAKLAKPAKPARQHKVKESAASEEEQQDAVHAEEENGQPSAPAGREWNFGVGPRPGVTAGLAPAAVVSGSLQACVQVLARGSPCWTKTRPPSGTRLLQPCPPCPPPCSSQMLRWTR